MKRVGDGAIRREPFRETRRRGMTAKPDEYLREETPATSNDLIDLVSVASN